MIIIKNSEPDIALSQHFSAKEFKCQCGQCAISIISEDLIERLEIVRNLFGFPVVITSGYRCQQHNRWLELDARYKAAKYSKHMEGVAADLALPPAAQQELFCKIVGAVFPYSYVKTNCNIIHADLIRRK